MNALKIIKKSGSLENFNINKLIKSLIRAGISTNKATEIAKKLEKKCTEGLSTKQLYRQALKLIRKENKTLATNYSMTRAISDLGPDGYHFEKFICKLFSKKGYTAKTNHFAEGRCVRHEIDVYAVNEKKIYCECKFHNSTNTKNDLKTALYVYARYLDLKENPNTEIDEFWLISNTKFTQDAVTYSNCVGLKLLSPNTPENHSLSDLAIQYKVYPVGVLTTLKKKHIKVLIEKGYIFASDIVTDNSILKILNLDEEKELEIYHEAKRLGGSK